MQDCIDLHAEGATKPLPEEGAGVEFRVLGPLEVASGGVVLPVGGARQRAVLALLLLRGNELVPRDRLIDALWGDSPPETAPNALQVAVHGLRRVLGPDRVATQGSGYRLRVETGELDLDRFEQLAEQARSQSAPRAAGTLREALGLWRGPALTDLGQATFAEPEGRRLEERRAAVLEQRIEADLALGRHAELVSELESLVAEHPYRERLRYLLMLALYRSGRQAEALEAYQAARRALVGELGVEPSPALQELERAILRHDPSLQPVSAAVPRSNLPAATTSLIGRQLELAAASALLRSDDVRLLTLTGAGGTGKTRLALAVAEEVADEFDDGVWLVTLAPVRDAELVASIIAGALAIEETSQTSLLEDLKGYLADKRALLLLDNFEHLTAAATLVTDLLTAAPQLKVLVTSRSVLRLSGEHDYAVPPLVLPDRSTWDDPESLSRNEAVALFVARAKAARPDFHLSGNARFVAEICVALDGLPLALELAAARVKILSAEELLARLAQRLPLLVQGPRDRPPRHQTLRAAIEWSFDLLDDDERALFAGLAVFAGGCTLEACEEVCEAGLETLASLVDKSLVGRRGSEEDARFTMLETVREYASERLEEGGESDLRRRRHAEHFLALAEEAEPELKGENAAVWLERLDAELDNVRAALAWAGVAGAVELELRLASALEVLWRLRGHLSEGRRSLEGALSRSGEAPPAVRAKALNTAAIFLHRQGEHGLAKGYLEEALALYRELGDDREVARMLSNLGSVALLEGSSERAAELYEETIPLFRSAGDDRGLMITLSNLASIANAGGDHARGRTLGEEGLAVARRLGDKDQVSVSLHNLGRADLRQGRHLEAGGRFAESLELAVELGYQEVIAYCLEAFGEIAANDQDWERAGRLLGAADGLFLALGIPMGADDREGYETTGEQLREQLGEAGLASLQAEGRALAPEQAVALALGKR